MHQAQIVVGSHILGTLQCDEAAISAEGGPTDPRLVLPLILRFNALTEILSPGQRPGRLALGDLLCSLHASAPAFPANQYGVAVPLRPPDGGVYHAFAGSSTTLTARIPLSPALITLIEARRHAAPDTAFTAALHFSGTACWVDQTYNETSLPGEARGHSAPWPMGMGPLYRMVSFATTRIEDLPLHIPGATWVDRVLPGLGITHHRLVELAFPTAAGLLGEQLAQTFDLARAEYDAGRYRECIQKCREVRELVQRYVRAQDSAFVPPDGKEDKSTEKYVQAIIKRLLNLDEEEPRYQFFRDSWNGWSNLTSAAHHAPGPSTARPLTGADARACLYLGAVLLDYLATLWSPPPLGALPPPER